MPKLIKPLKSGAGVRPDTPVAAKGLKITIKNYLALANKPIAFYQGQEIQNITPDEKYSTSKRYILKLQTHSVGAKPENTVIEIKDLNSIANQELSTIAGQVQSALFDDKDYLSWKNEWIGMPEFVQEDLMPFQSITVHFETEADRELFAKLVEQPITANTKSIWYPESEKFPASTLRYQSTENEE